MKFIELKMLLYEKHAILVFYVSHNPTSDLTFQSAWLPFPAKACAAQIMGSKYGEFSKLSTYGKINYEINNINDTTNRKLIIGLNWCTEGGRSG